MRNRSRAFAALESLVVGVLVACSTGDMNGPNCDAIGAALVSRIEVHPTTAAVNLGQSLQMQAVAFSCAGALNNISAFRWRSADTAVATVSPSGLVVAMTAGQVAIYAAVQGKEQSASITTQPAEVARVTVEPATAVVGVGRTSRLTAQAFDAQGGTIAGRPVTWLSANSGVVSVSAQGDITGATTGGPVTVTATIEGRSASSQITVVLVPVNSVTVAPPTATIAAGTTIQLTATLKDELGNVLIGRTVNWLSSDPAVASVDGAVGIVTGGKPGSATLTATSEGKSGTAEVTVTPGAAAKLEFAQQPSLVEAGAAIAPAVTVKIEDAAGNLLTTATTAVTLALAAPGRATLGGTLTVSAVNGLVTFSDVSVTPPGVYSLMATSPGLTSSTSTSFLVTARPATRLGFGQQPVSAVVGGTLGTVTVELQDATGARVTGQIANISLVIGTNPGQGTLSGSTTQSTSNGLATFNGLKIDRIGAGYTLVASANGLTGATSDPFDLTAGPATHLTFVQEPPGTVTVGNPVSPELSVQLRDAGGNAVSEAGRTIVLTMSGGGTLTNASALSNSSGLATFTGLVATAKAQTGYRITARSDGLGEAASQPFAVIAGAATQLAFLTHPDDHTRAGIPIVPPVMIGLRDAAGNVAITSAVVVTLTLSGNSDEATLTGNVATAAAGVAVFADLRVSKAGKNYRLVAASPGLSSAVSDKFSVR
jgi:uncharacterized protein YjdB